MPYGVVKHREPDCLDENNGCEYNEPHHHGLECDDTCVECRGKCHPSCPAYSESVGRGNRAFEKFLKGIADAKVSFVVLEDGEVT